jgi:CxxC motif-containing protein (DUF1111 family)
MALTASIAAGPAIAVQAGRVAGTDDATIVAQGRQLFSRVWTVDDGLGPEINARSCLGCHVIPTIGGSSDDPRALVILSPAVLDPTGGHVFRRLRISALGAVTEQQPPRDGVVRRPPSLHGSGYLEAIPHDQIVPPGTANDNHAGRVPRGRFGWKGRLRTIDEAVAAAFANELGLGSADFPDRSSSRSPHKGRELSVAQVDAVAAFIRSLGPPPAKNTLEARSGKEVFDRIGCAHCHRPTFPFLASKGLFPYTDLLLHKMGSALADRSNEADAEADEFKTPPLWGIGRSGPPYLHDGRAKSLHDAVFAHGGQAEMSAAAYRGLSVAETAMLLEFLLSL